MESRERSSERIKDRRSLQPSKVSRSESRVRGVGASERE